MFKKCIFGLLLILVVGGSALWMLGFALHGMVDSVNTPDPEPVAPTAIAPTAIAPTAIAPTAIATEEATSEGQKNWGIVPTSTPRTPRPIQ